MATASAADMPFFVATNSTFARSHCRNASSGGCLGFALVRQVDELLDLAAVDRLEQRLARREMPVQRADADAGLRAPRPPGSPPGRRR